LKDYEYQEEGHFAIVRTKPCDPNILGFISDLMLQVDIVDLCVIYCELPYGIKLSVRSCVRTVRADELAGFIVQGVGNGGGHAQKAGGFIPKTNLEMIAGGCEPGKYLYGRMEAYCRSCELIYAKDYKFTGSGMERYTKIPQRLGFVRLSEVLPPDSHIIIRTLEADFDLKVEEDVYVMIGVRGEVYPIQREKFEGSYEEVEGGFEITADYLPSVHIKDTGDVTLLMQYAHTCVPTGKTAIYAKPLDHTVKVFTAWDEENYMLGREGDYLAVRTDDLHDVYIIAAAIFEESYERG
ncbi:MAG: recombinase RecJ, partial [Lachnospiraceae bacterium]|nr:recombinase RecJ [Lachnospiraceae bacterium]